MRIGLLSNVTVDLLAESLRKKNEVYVPIGFDTWQQEIITPMAGLFSFRPEVIIILIHAGAYNWNNIESGYKQIDEWGSILKTLTERLPGIPVFVSSIDVRSSCQYGAEKRLDSVFEQHFIDIIQELHRDNATIYLLPVKDAITDIGRKIFYSKKMWYLGSMPYSMKGLTVLNEIITRYISVTKGMHKKCMVLDLDNTLWGGVIGEDGVDGIELSNHKEGERYYDAQIILKKMKERGVMLAIISKNNVEDVEPVFNHPYMILQHDDFVAEIINWESKSSNIKDLSKGLNISLDSFVFLDDNPVEREQMKAECPEVVVLDFPQDSSMLPETVEKAYYDYFFSLDITHEDTEKTAMYRAESLRRAEKASATSLDGYLKNLEMTMSIHRMLPDEEKRVVQLVNKTNQFNVTTKRYSEEEIKALSLTGDVITIHISDKYGDQGLVSVLIMKYDGNQAEIDTFLMSCRVMGRNVEYEIMKSIKGMLEKKGINKIQAYYQKTAKNSPVENLFERLGFTVIDCTETSKKYFAKVEDIQTSSSVFREVVERLL